MMSVNCCSGLYRSVSSDHLDEKETLVDVGTVETVGFSEVII